MQVRSGGAWKAATPSVRSGGTWKTPSEVWVKQGGTWVRCWQNDPNPVRGFITVTSGVYTGEPYVYVESIRVRREGYLDVNPTTLSGSIGAVSPARFEGHLIRSAYIETPLTPNSGYVFTLTLEYNGDSWKSYRGIVVGGEFLAGRFNTNYLVDIKTGENTPIGTATFVADALNNEENASAVYYRSTEAERQALIAKTTRIVQNLTGKPSFTVGIV